MDVPVCCIVTSIIRHQQYNSVFDALDALRWVSFASIQE